VISKVELRNFKCFQHLKMPLAELTLLAGSNASGKSSFLQSLVVLHQTIRENEWSKRLVLNGEILSLGTVQDVVNKIHGRNDFSLNLTDDESTYCWGFNGERAEMSMQVNCFPGEPISSDVSLNKLLPMEGRENQKICTTLETLTYITAERIGPRDFYALEDRRTIQTVGPKGEHAVSCLYRLAEKTVHSNLCVAGTPPTLMRQVEAWMQKFFPGCGVEITPIARMNAVSLGIRTSDETDYHRPVNVGFGLTQVLPILVATLSANENDLILIENPEVHLHPAGQALMGGFLAMIASSGTQIVLETHSDHVLNGIRRAVRSKVLTPSQVALHFFRPSTPDMDQVVSPQLDASGNIDFWPEGFFDQFDKDMNHFAGWGE